MCFSKICSSLPAGALRRRRSQTRHDLAQDGGVILRLDLAFGALDAEHRQIVAQPRQRALVQKAGEIVGAVRQQLAAAEPDEQIEEFALDTLDRHRTGRFRQRRMRDAERADVAAQTGQPLQQRGVRRARQQGGEQRVFLRARDIDLVDVAGRRLTPNRSGRRIARSTPVADSTESTRSAGMRSQFDTEGCEMPMRRASSLTPPTARIASWSPGSRIAELLKILQPAFE